MPVSGMARIRRMVENCDTEFLAIHRAGVVHPLRALPPYSVHPLPALRVHYVATFLLGECVRQANREGALFGVAEYYRKLRGQGDVEVDGAQLGIRVERHHAGF